MDSAKKRAILIFGLIILIALATWLSFTTEIKSAWQPRVIKIKNNGASQEQISTSQQQSNFWPLNAGMPEPVNFLLLGAPGRGNDAPDLTDTILLARLDSVKNKIYLFSLPRDLLVKIPDSENYTKFNALYAFNKSRTFLQKFNPVDSTEKNNATTETAGNLEKVRDEFDSLIKKTQDITGLTIDHYIFVDLQTVQQLVDIFGGVNVLVQKDILDTAFPGPNHSFQTFTIKSGWRYLDGATALKYMRSRHSAAGDFDRTARQQEILQALKQKILALNFWDVGKFMEIYNTLSSNIKSDLNLWQIKDYWGKIKNIPGENVIKTELNNQNLLINRQIDLGGERAAVVQPKAGVENYEEIKKYIANIIAN